MCIASSRGFVTCEKIIVTLRLFPSLLSAGIRGVVGGHSRVNKIGDSYCSSCMAWVNTNVFGRRRLLLAGKSESLSWKNVFILIHKRVYASFTTRAQFELLAIDIRNKDSLGILIINAQSIHSSP